MRELSYLIHDVREATDNKDINGVKDKEIIRYFQDAVRSVQALIFKNNPLCSYFQEPMDIAQPIAGRVFPLPDDCYAQNAVSFVEVQSEATSNDSWVGLKRRWPEDQHLFFGWFTRNKTIVFTGSVDVPLAQSARVWYFQRLPRWDKAWATVTGVLGQVATLTVLDADMWSVDGYISVYSSAGVLKLPALPYVKSSATTMTITGDITSIVAGDKILMGKNAALDIDLPEEVESYLLDYVAKRIFGRNNYAADGNKIDYFTQDDKNNIIAIFADVGQAQVEPPITDTDYLGL